MKRHIETDAVHAGEHPEWFNGALAGDITPSATYVILSSASLMDDYQGYFYTRLLNPTRRALQEKLAVMEGAESALALSSGMAAISVALLSILETGDLIICQRSLYGGTYTLMRDILPRWGIETLFVPREELYDLSHVPKGAKLVFIETPSNPTLRITDIKAVTNEAHKHGLKVIADNTFATCCLQRPLELGADAVVYSASKYLGGHNDVLAGVILGDEETVENANHLMKNLGSPLDPFSCYLLSRSIKTLPLRMRRAQSSAMKIARFIADHPKVLGVLYPGLHDDPDHKLAARQMKGFGAVVTFEVNGGLEGAKVVFDAFNLITRACSLGGTETTVSFPVLITHRELTEEQLKASGITPGMLRISVGLEDEVDLLEDIEQALNKVP